MRASRGACAAAARAPPSRLWMLPRSRARDGGLLTAPGRENTDLRALFRCGLRSRLRSRSPSPSRPSSRRAAGRARFRRGLPGHLRERPVRPAHSHATKPWAAASPMRLASAAAQPSRGVRAATRRRVSAVSAPTSAPGGATLARRAEGAAESGIASVMARAAPLGGPARPPARAPASHAQPLPSSSSPPLHIPSPAAPERAEAGRRARAGGWGTRPGHPPPKETVVDRGANEGSRRRLHAGGSTLHDGSPTDLCVFPPSVGPSTGEKKKLHLFKHRHRRTHPSSTASAPSIDTITDRSRIASADYNTNNQLDAPIAHQNPAPLGAAGRDLDFDLLSACTQLLARVARARAPPAARRRPQADRAARGPRRGRARPSRGPAGNEAREGAAEAADGRRRRRRRLVWSGRGRGEGGRRAGARRGPAPPLSRFFWGEGCSRGCAERPPPRPAPTRTTHLTPTPRRSPGAGRRAGFRGGRRDGRGGAGLRERRARGWRTRRPRALRPPRRQRATRRRRGADKSASAVTRSLFAGGLAGALSRTAVAPLERLKILYQVQHTKPPSVWSALVTIGQKEGLKGYFRGNGANCIRIFPNSALSSTRSRRPRTSSTRTSATPVRRKK